MVIVRGHCLVVIWSSTRLSKPVQREVFEETGLYIKNVHHGAYTNDIFTNEQKHYVTLFVTAEFSHGELELKEPHKCEQWDWFSWDDLPKPKFLSLENLLKQGFEV